MGNIAGKYRRRAANVGRARLMLQNEMRGVMKNALLQATDEQKYEVTNLPVSGAMRRSVKTRIRGDSVESYYDGAVAPHAPRVLNMHGTSKTGGHKLDMQPGKRVAELADAPLKRLNRRAQRMVIGD